MWRIYCDKVFFFQSNSLRFTSTSYECSMCGSTFTQCKELQQHMTTHSSFDTFECPLCEHDFLLAFQLKRHLEREHYKSRPYKCSICSKKFSSKERAVLHEEIHEVTLPHVCDKCGKSFRNVQVLLNHQRKHISKKKNICNLCHAKFDFASDLVIHLRNHTQEAVYECSDCDKTFVCKRSMKHHSRTHGAPDYMCGHCDMTLADLAAVTSHVLLSHQKQEMQVCSSCHMVFTSLRSLNMHLMELHEETPSWPCNHCNKCCASEKQQQDHEEICVSAKRKTRRVCKSCGVVILGNAALQKTATQLLREHKEIVGKFECPECGIIFVTACRLARHMDGHVAFTCEICNEVFYGKQAHDYHCRQHVPFPICIICERTFKTFSALHSHLRRTHGVAHASVCPVCCHYFSSKQLMEKHRNIHRYPDEKMKAPTTKDKSVGECPVLTTTSEKDGPGLVATSETDQLTAKPREVSDQGELNGWDLGILSTVRPLI